MAIVACFDQHHDNLIFGIAWSRESVQLLKIYIRLSTDSLAMKLMYYKQKFKYNIPSVSWISSQVLKKAMLSLELCPWCHQIVNGCWLESWIVDHFNVVFEPGTMVDNAHLICCQYCSFFFNWLRPLLIDNILLSSCMIWFTCLDWGYSWDTSTILVITCHHL